jgi:glycerol-3-phosphate cytidylyltransferase-like family protein
MTKKDKLIVTAGDYDYVNCEDLKFLEKCRALGDWLIVGLHSDMQVYLRCNTLHNKFDDRCEFLTGLRPVDEVIKFDDSKGNYCNLLKTIKLIYPLSDITFVTKHDLIDTPEKKIRGITFEVIN